jgi:uncharacterized membrane protein HdeD (DUF308 family)
MVDASLFERWWAIALRGVAAILFGVLTLYAPGTGLLALVYLFGAYALVDGVFDIVYAVRHRSYGALLVEGILSLAFGLVTFMWPRITGTALLYLIGAWAIVTGVAELAAAIRLRKVIRNEWLMGLAGLLSIAFGVLLFAYPSSGALAFAIWIAVYAIIFGGVLVALGFRLRSLRSRRGMEIPSGGVRAPA